LIMNLVSFSTVCRATNFMINAGGGGGWLGVTGGGGGWLGVTDR
jgi:hypothetical protein